MFLFGLFLGLVIGIAIGAISGMFVYRNNVKLLEEQLRIAQSRIVITPK